jgi:hypothetical protein
MMKTFNRLPLLIAACLPLAGCDLGPNPNVSKPFVYPDGRVVQPPPNGWPSYAPGGESGKG